VSDDPVTARFSYTHHLVALVGRSEAAAARLAWADPERRAGVAASARRESARLSARLDASPLGEATADEVDAREARGLPPIDAPPAAHDAAGGEAAGGGWAQALGLEGLPTQDVAAVEYANLLACSDAEPEIAGRLYEDPLGALRALQARICRGLVAGDVTGGLRRTDQAVHDGAQGQMLYTPPPPARLPALLDALAAWLSRGSVRYPALVVAGVVHGRILEWQPFEAANGRTARAAGRLVLRARGLDPHGLAVTERWLAADPLGYHREVAATIRRRGDPALWLERFGEALCAALEAAADAVQPQPALLAPARAARFAEGLAPGEPVTLAEYARAHGVVLPAARADLEALVRAGSLRLETGSRGLRYRRPDPLGGRPPGQA
jgi:hypothetical protein